MKPEERRTLADLLEKSEGLVLLTVNDRIPLERDVLRELIELLREKK